jgi:hypothetical protein
MEKMERLLMLKLVAFKKPRCFRQLMNDTYLYIGTVFRHIGNKISEDVGVAAALYACIQEMIRSSVSWDTSYSARGFGGFT